MPEINQQLKAHSLYFEHAKKISIAYSGGLDSHVLLHAAVNLLGSDRVTAIHVNHQLSDQANTWAAHCNTVCKALNITQQTYTVRLDTNSSIENAAREARYQAFEKALGEQDVLLLAHHLDDQAETILYRLLRSAGPRGLAGIPVTRPLGRGQLVRPFLKLSRKALEDYARKHKLQWIEDPSNQSLQHDRNYLRHQVIPTLHQRWPDFAKRIATSAQLCGHADTLNQDLADIDLNNLNSRREKFGWSIDLLGLQALSQPRQANILRRWAQLNAIKAPGYHRITASLHTLFTERKDSKPLISWPEGQFRRFKSRLFLLPVASFLQTPACKSDLPHTQNLQDDTKGPENKALFWHPQEGPINLSTARATLEGCTPQEESTLHVTRTKKEGGLRVNPKHALKVMFRSGSERCQPSGRVGSRSLKKLFQEYQLEPWLRNQIPLLYQKNTTRDDNTPEWQLVAVADLWVCQGFETHEGEDGYAFHWTIQPPLQHTGSAYDSA